jgi:hypothetical protein
MPGSDTLNLSSRRLEKKESVVLEDQIIISGWAVLQIVTSDVTDSDPL